METPASLFQQVTVTRIKRVFCSATSRVPLPERVPLHSSAWRKSGRFADMHHLRTTFLRLRPLTATQAAQRLSQPRLSVITEGLRTFQPSRPLNTSEPFLNGTNSNYIEEMYYAWLDNPKNVHKVKYASTLTQNHIPAKTEGYLHNPWFSDNRVRCFYSRKPPWA